MKSSPETLSNFPWFSFQDIMDDVNFVYDSALLHIDPSKSGGYESSADEPEENTTLLDTVREKLRKEYGGKARTPVS